jgi:hypothetical protein
MTVDRLLAFIVLGAVVGLIAANGVREHTRACIECIMLGTLGGLAGGLAGAAVQAPALPAALAGAWAAILLLRALSAQSDRLIRVNARRERRE